MLFQVSSILNLNEVIGLSYTINSNRFSSWSHNTEAINLKIDNALIRKKKKSQRFSLRPVHDDSIFIDNSGWRVINLTFYRREKYMQNISLLSFI